MHDDVRYKYVLELYKEGEDEHIGTFAVTPDWEPALEWARFSTICRDPVPPIVLTDCGAIQPRAQHKGEPYLEGVTVTVSGKSGKPAAFDIPLTYFGSMARTASSELIETGKLAAGDIFQYLLCAYACEDRSTTPGGRTPASLAVESVGQILEISDSEMESLLARSSICGSSQGDGEILPVFIPSDVIDEAADLMSKAGAKETGGILIGHLRRDPGRRELFLEVTAQIQAQHAEEELSRLTFTPETWSAADSALALRGRGEIYVGWWHSHPASHWCDACPPETRRRCKVAGKLSGDFFSEHDRALHRAVFPRAYSVALVLSDGCSGTPAWRLWGWQRGMVASRSFHQLHNSGL